MLFVVFSYRQLALSLSASALLARAVDVAPDASNRGDLLEVERFDQGEELVFGVLDRVIDELVREEDRIVRHFNLPDGLADAHLELLLRLDPVADPAAELLETRRVNEEEVALMAALVNLQSALDVDLDDGDFAAGLDALQLSPARAIEAAFRLLPMLNELPVGDHALEVGRGDEVEILLSLLVAFADRSRRVTLLPIKDVAILFQHEVDQGALADARRPNQDQRLVLLRCRVEWVEVLLGVDKDIVL